MSLMEEFKIKMIEAKKSNDFIKSSNYSVLMGEIQRQPNKNISEQDIIKIIKKLYTAAIESPVKDNNWIELLKSYLPIKVSSEEILNFINSIDLSLYQGKDRIKLMKVIMTHFGNTVDGSEVKRILMELN